MNKISLIIQQEYLSRVKRKSFILMTLLTPLLFIAVMLVPTWLAEAGDNEHRNIVIADQTGLYESVFTDTGNYSFHYTTRHITPRYDTDGDSEETYAYIVISDNLLNNPKGIVIYSEKQVNADFKSTVEQLINTYLTEEKIASYNIPDIKKLIADSKTNINIATIRLEEDGTEAETSTELATIIGIISTIAIYMFLLLYGVQVMQAVMQEKTSRIVEVMVSSVKPFDLMFGKITAIGLVGLTQFLIWVIFIAGIIFPMGILFGVGKVSTEAANTLSSMQGLSATTLPAGAFDNIEHLINGIHFPELFICFILFFIGGYMLYSSLFAAIGSAVDSEADTQQFMVPVTVIIIVALYLGIYSAQSPDSGIALWSSLFPFTSPIVMMVRIPFGVPAWQIVLSLVILFASFIGAIWISSRIYRVGILMYGKKIGYKEIVKWIKYKE
ncbi:ABC transporter permease [Coprobacter secundus]|uniref:ABC transporter permease n=1 Tax=Coprobacter secundus subsp. similis TaxID=2751153 RepID=A0A7G1HQY9_9BACT|nr:ABC transporter permease [Coprobacter secundus]BCI62085.1 ABC transporter permease [Coprobacter secundus subsp. similis]